MRAVRAALARRPTKALAWKDRPDRKVFTTSKSTNHWTPAEIFAPLDEEFRFTLDPAASAESAKCPVYYTKKQDGLTLPWRGRVFCNPPYQRAKAGTLGKTGDWVAYGLQQVELRISELVCFLLPSSTSNAWFTQLRQGIGATGRAFYDVKRDRLWLQGEKVDVGLTFITERVGFLTDGKPAADPAFFSSLIAVIVPSGSRWSPRELR